MTTLRQAHRELRASLAALAHDVADLIGPRPRGRHDHCDSDPNECSVEGLQGELAECQHQLKPYARTLGIALAVADMDPLVNDDGGHGGICCVFCEAEPPGTATTLPESQHRAHCTWRAARQLVADMEADQAW